MLPKTQSPDDVAAAGTGIAVIGLIESALGIVSHSDICKTANVQQLAFGSIDYALNVGCVEEREALLLARLSIVTQSRAHNLVALLDGVTVSVNGDATIQSDAEYAVVLGFGVKLVIHPRQVDIVMAAMRPSLDDLAWAQSVCAAAGASEGAAFLVDGQMIDAPVIEKARRILRGIEMN